MTALVDFYNSIRLYPCQDIWDNFEEGGGMVVFWMGEFCPARYDYYVFSPEAMHEEGRSFVRR